MYVAGVGIVEYRRSLVTIEVLVALLICEEPSLDRDLTVVEVVGKFDTREANESGGTISAYSSVTVLRDCKLCSEFRSTSKERPDCVIEHVFAALVASEPSKLFDILSRPWHTNRLVVVAEKHPVQVGLRINTDPAQRLFMVDIVCDDAIRSGNPRIEGTRITVLDIKRRIIDNREDPHVVAGEYGISMADLFSALAYYYDHRESFEARERERESRRRDAEHRTGELLAA